MEIRCCRGKHSFCLFSEFARALAPVVVTDPSRAFEEGSEASLSCHYDREIYYVRWETQEGNEEISLVTLDLYDNVGERTGSGYEEGRFNITDDYSLIIKDISYEDGGIYICEVTDLSLGRVFRSNTIVTIILSKMIIIISWWFIHVSRQPRAFYLNKRSTNV